ncbi:MAG: hypothetical protein KDB61_12015, partial [Planctomycetes bacterium]|nr:hypothetical protein [Planctomycetota bacterium]
MKPVALALLLSVPTSLFALATGTPPIGGEEPIVLKVDERTKMPMGPMVEPRGALLDPRDIPDAVASHINVAAGLTGFESSLTALFAKNLGFVVEAKKLPKAYQAMAKSQRDNWNEQIIGIRSRLDLEHPEELVYAALYHDTG